MEMVRIDPKKCKIELKQGFDDNDDDNDDDVNAYLSI